MMRGPWLAVSLLCCVFVAVLSPIYSLTLFGLVSCAGRVRAAIWLSFTTVCIAFLILNQSKAPSSDWLWYSRHFQYIADNGLDAYFRLSLYKYSDLSAVYGIAPRATEPAFYILCAFLALLPGGGPAFLNAAITLLVFAPITLTVGAMARRIEASGTFVYLVVLAVAGIGISLPLVTHLVRQELAMAALFPATYFLLSGKHVSALALSILSVAFHNSAVVVVGLLLAAYVASVVPVRWRLISLALMAVAVSGGAVLMLNSERVDLVKDDGGISALAYALDASILVGAITLMRQQSNRAFARFLTNAVLLYAVLLISVSPAKLVFLRFYFYGDLIRSLCILVVIYGLWRTGVIKKGATVLLCGLAIMVFADARVAASSFDYSASLFMPWPNEREKFSEIVQH